MVCYALRISALCDSMYLLRHYQLLLLHDLEIADYVYRRLRGDEGELVELLVLEELVSNLYDSLLSEELAGKVDTYGDLAFYTFEVEDVEGLVYVFSGYVVQNGTILQCADYQFFSVHIVLFIYNLKDS